MLNRIMAAFLSLTLLINPCFAQENTTEANFEIPMVWEAGELETTLGDYELTVWILPVANMEAPRSGYLLLRDDYTHIKRVMDNLQLEINRIRSEERASCDLLLVQKDEDCRNLNSELRATIDLQTTQITGLNTNIIELKDDIFWWRVGAGAAGVLAISFGLFAISK